MDKDYLTGKVAIITGASRGIGTAISKMIAEMGCNIVIVGRDQERLGKLENQFSRYGVKIKTLSVDLSDESAPEKIIQQTIAEFGRLDILINNAGIAYSKSIEETDINMWDTLMNINARAPFFLCKAALPYLKKSDQGTIINISSVIGRLGYINQAAYGASKHALMGFSKVLSLEVQKHNIRVHVIAPGGVATDLVKRMRPDIDEALLMQPEEIAGIVSFLLTFKGNAMIDEINVRRFASAPWR